MTDTANTPALIPGVSIVEGAKARAEEEAALLAEHGIQMPDTYFALGTKMMAQGEAKARELRAPTDALPYLKPGAEAFADRITAERRTDVRDVELARVRVDESGLLRRVLDNGTLGGTALTVTSNAYSQLATLAPEGVTGASRYNVNSWLGRKKAKRVLRTRYPNKAAGTRDCYAVVSDKYAVFDSHEILREAAKILPADSKVSVLYQDGRARDAKTGRELPMRTRADVIISNPFKADELGVGRVHEVFLRLRTADDGTRGISIDVGARRISCINCTILTGTGASFRRRHVGERATLQQMIQEAIAESGKAIDAFSVLWREANIERIHDAYDGSTLSARAVFERLVAAEYVKVPGCDGRAAVDQLLWAWEMEPGDTAAAVNRAVSRLAHEGSWRSIEATEELEEQAGQLLYARLYRLNPLTDQQHAYFDGDDEASLN